MSINIELRTDDTEMDDEDKIQSRSKDRALRDTHINVKGSRRVEVRHNIDNIICEERLDQIEN